MACIRITEYATFSEIITARAMSELAATATATAKFLHRHALRP